MCVEILQDPQTQFGDLDEFLLKEERLGPSHLAARAEESKTQVVYLIVVDINTDCIIVYSLNERAAVCANLNLLSLFRSHCDDTAIHADVINNQSTGAEEVPLAYGLHNVGG